MTTERDTRPVTIRNLAAYWRIPVEDLLDMPISVYMTDGHLHSAWDQSDMSFPNVRMVSPDEGYPNRPGQLTFEGFIKGYRLVKERKAAAE